MRGLVVEVTGVGTRTKPFPRGLGEYLKVERGQEQDGERIEQGMRVLLVLIAQ